MIEAGLPEDAALASLTTAPGWDARVIRSPGFSWQRQNRQPVISDKPYFNEKAKFVTCLWKNNVQVRSKDSKILRMAKKAKVRRQRCKGRGWVEHLYGNSNGIEQSGLHWRRKETPFPGTMSGGSINPAVGIDNAKLDGNSLTFNFTFNYGGSDITVEVAVKIEGDTFKRNVNGGWIRKLSNRRQRLPK